MSYNAPAGPLLMGYMVSLGLYGVLTVQIYLYHAAFPRDAIQIKVLVYFVHLIETAKSILMVYDSYDIFAVGFSDQVSLHSIHHIWFTCCIVNGLLAFIVQMLYAYRIKVISGSYIGGTAIALLSVLQIVGSIISGVGGKAAGRLDVFLKNESIGYVIAKLSGAVCDILIGILMTYYLLRMKMRSRLTEDVVTRILRLVVGGGILTCVFAIIDVILHYTDKGGSSWTFRQIIGKLYSNAMMVVFNSRFSIRNVCCNRGLEAPWVSVLSLDNVQEIETRVSFGHPMGSSDDRQTRVEEPDLSRTCSVCTEKKDEPKT